MTNTDRYVMLKATSYNATLAFPAHLVPTLLEHAKVVRVEDVYDRAKGVTVLNEGFQIDVLPDGAITVGAVRARMLSPVSAPAPMGPGCSTAEAA